MNFDTFLSWALGIIGLAGVAGGALAVLTTSRRTKLDEINDRQRKDLENRVDFLEAEVGRHKEREYECEKRIGEQQGQISTLRELVTQAAAVAELKAVTQVQLSEIKTGLDRLREAISANHQTNDN